MNLFPPFGSISLPRTSFSNAPRDSYCTGPPPSPVPELVEGAGTHRPS